MGSHPNQSVLSLPYGGHTRGSGSVVHGMTGKLPLIVVSHRKRMFLETALNSLRVFSRGLREPVIVDDSGSSAHRAWLAQRGYKVASVGQDNEGYLSAMNKVWEVAYDLTPRSDYVFLWEEDFTLTRPLNVGLMVGVMDEHYDLAQLNVQRQPVYGVERRHGFIASHEVRGYGISKHRTGGVPWVRRERPFTTNPCLLRSSVLDVPWPTREEADQCDGGAEPAMSLKLEPNYAFGWFGAADVPHSRHIGSNRKTGTGY